MLLFCPSKNLAAVFKMQTEYHGFVGLFELLVILAQKRHIPNSCMKKHLKIEIKGSVCHSASVSSANFNFKSNSPIPSQNKSNSERTDGTRDLPEVLAQPVTLNTETA